MNWKFWEKNKLEESNVSFKNKVKPEKQNQGEGREELGLGVGMNSLSSFNSFYSRYINTIFTNERQKIGKYRDMASMPEISDVIEDAVIESMQENEESNIIAFDIKNDEIAKNKNIVKQMNEEFKTLFFNRLNIEEVLWNGLLGYYTDGRVYYERVSGNSKKGIVKLKKLPSESMDYDYDENGNITAFYQYLTPNAPKPLDIKETEKREDVIGFFPQQISFINTGMFGQNKKIIIGYLEKCTQAFNQLKMLETSLIIYRIVRAPERLVFKIDTGNMPKDKAMKYIDKVANKFKQKQNYNPDTGQLESSAAITSILENYFIGQSADGRGSDISTVGGSPGAFSEMDDIFYFQKKLYRSLKYPMSRVMKMNEGQNSDILYAGGNMGEIQRDEIKWAKFLERQQSRFCEELKNIFLLHLEFIGYKKEIGIKASDFEITMNAPNQYKEQMNQMALETRMSNYTNLSNNEEFPKSWLMTKYLKLDEDDLKSIEDGWKRDKTLVPKEEADEY